jgi:hypothetical protein
MATGRVPTTANSPLTAKGDLFTYSTAPARLAVGNNGESLVADSSTSTGLRYTAGTVQANPVLNSAMQCWQRGTSFSFAASTTASSSTYTADRWQLATTGANQAVTISRQATGDTTNLPFIQYALRFQRNSGQTGTGALQISQHIETINSIPYAGKTVTYSFYARAGANFSAAGGALDIFNMTGTGTDQNANTGAYTGAAAFTNTSATLTTTWQRFSYTSTLAATTTELSLNFKYTPVGTAGAADFFEITGVQLDIGSVALPFRTYAATIQGELAACQRYYYRAVTNGVSTTWFSNGFAYNSTRFLGLVKLPVRMRVNPTSIETSGTAADYRVLVGATTGTATAVPTLDTSNWDNTLLNLDTTGLTAGQGGILGANSTNNAYIGFNAEL